MSLSPASTFDIPERALITASAACGHRAALTQPLYPHICVKKTQSVWFHSLASMAAMNISIL